MDELNDIKAMYVEAASAMPRYKEEDGMDWDDYERFAKKLNGKLKDLNRKNLRHIELIKQSWGRQRMKHI